MAHLTDGERFITVNGVAHWCKISGAKNNTTPMVIVHGGPGGHLYVFERTIGKFLERFSTVIYYEQRGCGRSSKPEDPRAYSIPLLVDDLEKLRQQWQVEKMIPLGFSFGGELALEYALAHPGRVEKIIVQAPSCGDWVRIAYVQLVGFCRIVEEGMRSIIESLIDEEPSILEAWTKAWGMVTPEIVDRFSFHRAESADLCNRYWAESKMGFNDDMAKIIQSNKRSNLLQRLTRISAPTLVLVGLHDRNTGLEISRDVSVSLQNAVLEIFEESAHFPEIEEPEKYAEVVRKFLNS